MGKCCRALAGAAVFVGAVMLAGCAEAVDIAPTPTALSSVERAEEISTTLVLTGAAIGATASSALAAQVNGPFEIFCDEGDYEVSVGTQVTCTFADDNGDIPAYIEITAIDGSEYELSVSVP